MDELHTQPSRELYDVLKTSMGARRQPLIISITTAGHDRESICYEVWDYARKVRDGVVDDPHFCQ
jgi:phage terminase large subunit-like protein